MSEAERVLLDAALAMVGTVIKKKINRASDVLERRPTNALSLSSVLLDSAAVTFDAPTLDGVGHGTET